MNHRRRELEDAYLFCFKSLHPRCQGRDQPCYWSAAYLAWVRRLWPEHEVVKAYLS